MSVQVFLQGYFRGIEEFLVSPPHPDTAAGAGKAGERLIVARSRWISLLSETLPRALLSELGLPNLLLGASGGGQFLVVLPAELVEKAEELLPAAAAGVRELSGGRVSLEWTSTENLGDWTVVRRRLTEDSERSRLRPASGRGADIFEPFIEAEPAGADSYFTTTLAEGLREARQVGWSPEEPARVFLDEGKYVWPLVETAEAIPVARHAAPAKGTPTIAGPRELASRSQGCKAWAVLRGDVDDFLARVRRLQSIEEYVQLSLLFKRFFAGELEVLCSMPEYWQKATILYTGNHDFAVFGAWDALVSLAHEIQRLFHRFNEENLKDIPGADGKTISMALQMASSPGASLAEVYRQAGEKLTTAKLTEKDCFHVFGHTVEWRQMAHAAELKENLCRLVKEFGGSPQLLGDLVRFYRKSSDSSAGPLQRRFDRPWRYYRRLRLVAAGARDREYQKLRSKLVGDLLGKNTAQARLRPGGRVALEWARLLSEA